MITSISDASTTIPSIDNDATIMIISTTLFWSSHFTTHLKAVHFYIRTAWKVVVGMYSPLQGGHNLLKHQTMAKTTAA